VLVVFTLAMGLGFLGMVLGSRRAVNAATELAASTQIPPFFVGATLLAIGTDLPEIANSIASSVTDHGDVNVGDSVGSAATQVTLILGMLPLIGGAITVPRRGILTTGVATIASLLLLIALMWDGHLGRVDAVLLITGWAVATRFIYSRTAVDQQLTMVESVTPRLRLAGRAMLALLGVALAAMLSVWAIVGWAESAGAPELLVGFFLASIGTSMPELVFNITALRRGAVALAIGDVFGASFADASLSVAAGPLIAPTDITRDLAVEVTSVAIVAVLAAVVIMTRVKEHDWRTGLILLAIYGGFFAVLL
jgi:cation:H+ antiporter